MSEVDVVNRALSAIGTRSTIASLTEVSNEAIQANLHLHSTRDELLRIAPWNCAMNYVSMSLISAAPGTPENPTVGTPTWVKGIPPPPWVYEYAYPSDCLRALYIVPQFPTGFASGVPVTTALTGGAPSFWNGPPVRFKVAIDQINTGTGKPDANGIDTKVVLTNQQQAILCYIKQVTNPDVWDSLFRQAVTAYLASKLVIALTGDKALANSKISDANQIITLARQGDGNEGLTVNDVSPDWMRIRGISYPVWEYSPNILFDW